MSPYSQSFPDFVQWLRTRSEEFTAQGAIVEFQVSDLPRASVRLRIERGQRLGELTVWSEGDAHLAVVDLLSGDFVRERDGLSLTDDAFTPELNEFFALLTNEE